MFEPCHVHVQQNAQTIATNMFDDSFPYQIQQCEVYMTFPAFDIVMIVLF